MTVTTSCRQRGFTLVEVVVSIALFALLMSLVYGAFGTSVRAHDAGLARTDEHSSMRVVSEFLHNSIAAAAPVAANDGRDWAVLFTGDGEHLSFVSDLPGHVGTGGLHQIVVEQQRVDGKKQLVMRRRPVSLDEDGELEGEFLSRVLLPESEDFAVRFFGSRDEEDPSWHDEWTAARQPPLLVELAITPREAPAWPKLRIRPRANNIRYLGNVGHRGAGGQSGDRDGATPESDDDAAAGTLPEVADPDDLEVKVQ